MEYLKWICVFGIALTLCNCKKKTETKQTGTEEILLDSIPFTMTEGNNIMFSCLLDEKDSIQLFFDTGGTELVLLHDAIKNETSLLQNRNKGYQEIDFEPLEETSSLRIGNLVWDSLNIYPARVGPKEMAGHFGWDLFKGKIIELNYDEKVMVVHPGVENITEGFQKIPIEYTNTLFCIDATLSVSDQLFQNRYLFDSGFQRAIVLDKELRKKDGFPNNLTVLKESTLRNSRGDVFINKVVNTDQICFGELCADNVPAQLIVTPNPARFETNILGNELLKRFNTILDFKNHHVYLKANSLMSQSYTDAQ